MHIGLLQLQRARKQLDAFCAQHSAAGSEMRCHVQDDSLLLDYNGQSRVRLKLDEAQWHIFWCRGDTHWVPWPHLPVCDDIQQVLAALEQAPLHVHWSE